METLISLFTKTAEAHVGYVVGHDEIIPALGADPSYISTTFLATNNLVLMVLTALFVLLVAYSSTHIPAISRWFKRINTTADTYREFIPWILRLSLGIALLGAATAQVLISPLLPWQGPLLVVQMILGFAFMFGFLVTPASFATIALYIYGLSLDNYLVGNLETTGAALALIALGSARPGFDDLVGIPEAIATRFKSYVSIILRTSIGGAMVYLALFEKLFNPHLSELVVTQYQLTSLVPVSPEMWVVSVGIIELVIGIALLIGWQQRTVTVITFLVLIVTFFGFREAVYAHVTLFGVLSALFILGSPTKVHRE
jgi:uncharacterized membrane protein YphA (DoxX/SURF4 family)